MKEDYREGENAMKPITHPIVVEHLMILEEYFKKQKELFNLVTEGEPKNEYEENSYKVRTMELNQEIDKLSIQLNETINKLATIPYTDYRNSG